MKLIKIFLVVGIVMAGIGSPSKSQARVNSLAQFSTPIVYELSLGITENDLSLDGLSYQDRHLGLTNVSKSFEVDKIYLRDISSIVQFSASLVYKPDGSENLEILDSKCEVAGLSVEPASNSGPAKLKGVIECTGVQRKLMEQVEIRALISVASQKRILFEAPETDPNEVPVVSISATDQYYNYSPEYLLDRNLNTFFVSLYQAKEGDLDATTLTLDLGGKQPVGSISLQEHSPYYTPEYAIVRYKTIKRYGRVTREETEEIRWELDPTTAKAGEHTISLNSATTSQIEITFPKTSRYNYLALREIKLLKN